MRNTIKFNLANDELESQISDHLVTQHQMKKEATINGRLPTSGVFCIALNITSWSEIKKKPGKLKYFEFPKKHE